MVALAKVLYQCSIEFAGFPGSIECTITWGKEREMNVQHIADNLELACFQTAMQALELDIVVDMPSP